MIIVCQNCSSRLQVDDERISAHAVTKCPKCNHEINLAKTGPATEKGALAPGGSPSTDVRRFQHGNPAPLFEPEVAIEGNQASGGDLEKFMQMMSGFLGQRTSSEQKPGERPSWNKRRALVCCPQESREK